MAAKKVKSILISQPKPTEENSPYLVLAKKYGLKMEFRKFIQIQGISSDEFRKQNVNPLAYTAVIFTSKYAIDNYFRILKDLKIELPPDMKYFCVSEATAKYLQKYIIIRKRKLFVGEKTAKDLQPLIRKHGTEKYLFPCSSIHTPDVTDFLKSNNYNFTEAIIYNTVPSDVRDVKLDQFDMLCFFSPSGIDSLFTNFPGFEQGDTVIGVFGPTTAKSAKDRGLKVDIEAPAPNAPSMTAAIENYLKGNGSK